MVGITVKTTTEDPEVLWDITLPYVVQYHMMTMSGALSNPPTWNTLKRFNDTESARDFAFEKAQEYTRVRVIKERD